MKKQSFYVDACVYLNLWQKEADFWRSAKDFFEKFDCSSFVFYYSGFLLKELEFVLKKEEFDKKRVLFNSSPNFRKAFLSREEFIQARKIEFELSYEISFYDIIHLLLSRKTGSILVTQDRKLLGVANRYSVIARRPIDLL